MALQYVGSIGLGHQAGSTSVGATMDLTALTGGIDTAARTGDIVLVGISCPGTTDNTVGMSTAGYSSLGHAYGDKTVDSSLTAHYKIMEASADTSAVTSPSGATNKPLSVVVHVWRGVDSGTPLDVAVTTVGKNNGTLIDPADITPVTTGAFIVIFATSAAGGGSIAYTAVGGLENSLVVASSSTTYRCAGVGSIAWTSGTYNPTAWTASRNNTTSDSAAAVTVALRSAPFSGPANLKSYNTNLKANIKSINTNLIANVKSLDTNA